jgi:hypothetical protein
MVRPSALALLKFMTSSNVVGFSMARAAGTNTFVVWTIVGDGVPRPLRMKARRRIERSHESPQPLSISRHGSAVRHRSAFWPLAEAVEAAAGIDTRRRHVVGSLEQKPTDDEVGVLRTLNRSLADDTAAA